MKMVRRVLVVDDHRDSTDSLALLLELRGHEVRSAYDGQGALEIAREFHPEVVFLDIGMPGIDGYGVARTLRELAPKGNPTVLVAVTGWSRDEDRQRSREAGRCASGKAR